MELYIKLEFSLSLEGFSSQQTRSPRKLHCSSCGIEINKSKWANVRQYWPMEEVPSSSSPSGCVGSCGMCSIFHNIFDRCDLCNRLWLSTFPFVRGFCSCVRKTYRIVAIVSGFWVWIRTRNSRLGTGDWDSIRGVQIKPGDQGANELKNLCALGMPPHTRRWSRGTYYIVLDSLQINHIRDH